MGDDLCTACKMDLGGMEYLEDDEDKPYCVPCYEKQFCNTCAKCNKKIGIDCRDVKFKTNHYHEGCFICSGCKAKLGGKQFIKKGDSMFCLKCQDVDEKQQCDGCNLFFKPGEKRMSVDKKFYHDKCFCCESCKKPIGTGEYSLVQGKTTCSSCYSSKFSNKCKACGKNVSGGLTYKDATYHAECFVCEKCRKPLADISFTSKDEVAYCTACYKDLFCPKCAICNKPIEGKYSVYENSSFHVECFNCSKCAKNLAKESFLKKEDQFFCAACV